jgi:hypothetical protein
MNDERTDEEIMEEDTDEMGQNLMKMMLAGV